MRSDPNVLGGAQGSVVARGWGQTFRRVVLLATAVAILAAGCGPDENDPDDGSITYLNDSDRQVVITSGLDGEPGSLDAAFAQGRILRTLERGQTLRSSYSFSSDAEDGEFCQPARIVVWILESKDGTIYEGRQPSSSYVAADFDVLEVIGPNICWGARDAEYVYSG